MRPQHTTSMHGFPWLPLHKLHEKIKMKFAMIPIARPRDGPSTILRLHSEPDAERPPATPKGYRPRSRCIVSRTGQAATLFERDQEEEQMAQLQTELDTVLATCDAVASSLG